MTTSTKIIRHFIYSLIAFYLVFTTTVMISNAATLSPAATSLNHTGDFLLRGKVESISGNSLTINSWGGAWLVNGNFNGNFNIGDFVGVVGTPSSDYSLQLSNVKAATDWSKTQIISSAQVPTFSSGALYTGIVTGITPQSIFVTLSDGSLHAVPVDTSKTVLWNNKKALIMLLDIRPNDNVRVNGTLQSDSSILPDVIVDTTR